MLRSRLIPVLLIRQGGLVKTTRFTDPKYVGDPLNAVRIFNDKQVDELVLADIDASTKGHEPDYSLISRIASECRMPLCYGGGLKTVDQIDRIIGLGVEKVAIGSSLISNPDLLVNAAHRFGSQSIVAVLDVKKAGLRRSYEVFTHNGAKRSGFHPVELAIRYESLGAGEILLNSVDRDGTLLGYDMTLTDMIRNAVSLPMTVVGGAGTFEDVRALVSRYGLIGAAAGSLFVFKGKHRAVLIQYPDKQRRDSLRGDRY